MSITFTHSHIYDLFEQIATKHKDISHSNTNTHFAEYGIEQIIGDELPDGIREPLLVLEKSEGHYGADSDLTSAFKDRILAFHVLKMQPDVADTDLTRRLQDECEVIANEIMAYLLLLAKGKTTWLSSVDLSRTSDQLEEGAFGSWVGIRVTTVLGAGQYLFINEDKWHSL